MCLKIISIILALQIDMTEVVRADLPQQTYV
jgi:hypothetical protein